MNMFSFEKIGRLGIISMNKPPANGYETGFFNELLQLLDEIEADSELAVLLLKSAIPKFFSAGADIKVFGSNSVQQNKDMVVLAHKTAHKISHSSKIYIAFLNGHTLGGGLELAMACDIRLASDKKFLLGLPEVNLGLMPGNGGIPRLINLIGASRAFELIVSGGTFSSQEGYQYGLINKLFEALQAETLALDYAKELSMGPQKAMTAIKETFREGIGKSLKDFLALETKKVDGLYDTHDAKEGFQAFLEKRKAEFE